MFPHADGRRGKGRSGIAWNFPGLRGGIISVTAAMTGSKYRPFRYWTYGCAEAAGAFGNWAFSFSR